MGVEVEDRHDVLVVEGGDDPRLPFEPPLSRGVVLQRRRQHLDGHLASQPFVARAIDLPHSPCADATLDDVRPEMPPRLQGRRYRGGIAAAHLPSLWAATAR